LVYPQAVVILAIVACVAAKPGLLPRSPGLAVTQAMMARITTA